MTDLKILYVEDEAADAELLLMNIERYRPDSALHFLIVDTVDGAQDMIDAQDYDAAIVDWNLPDGLGTDLAKYIRGAGKDMPILFLSGVFTPDRRTEAEHYAPSACLEKDFSKEHVENLHRLIQDMLKSGGL